MTGCFTTTDVDLRAKRAIGRLVQRCGNRFYRKHLMRLTHHHKQRGAPRGIPYAAGHAAGFLRRCTVRAGSGRALRHSGYPRGRFAADLAGSVLRRCQLALAIRWIPSPCAQRPRVCLPQGILMTSRLPGTAACWWWLWWSVPASVRSPSMVHGIETEALLDDSREQACP